MPSCLTRPCPPPHSFSHLIHMYIPSMSDRRVPRGEPRLTSSMSMSCAGPYRQLIGGWARPRPLPPEVEVRAAAQRQDGNGKAAGCSMSAYTQHARAHARAQTAQHAHAHLSLTFTPAGRQAGGRTYCAVPYFAHSHALTNPIKAPIQAETPPTGEATRPARQY